jgi:hypothetical protein
LRSFRDGFSAEIYRQNPKQKRRTEKDRNKISMRGDFLIEIKGILKMNSCCPQKYCISPPIELVAAGEILAVERSMWSGLSP